MAPTLLRQGLPCAAKPLTYPEPPSFREHAVVPESAYFDTKLGEFILHYEEVRKAENQESILMEFLVSTYNAAADTAYWNCLTLKCSIGRPRHPRPVR